MSALVIREVDAAGFDAIWPLFRSVIAGGDTYSYPSDMRFDDARALWTTPPSRTFAAEDDGRIVGCYMLKPNQPGLGDHVARVWETPAHTAGHISFHFADDGVIFVGDTLFAMGCGRLFEGDAAQMFANMQRLAALPGETSVYAAHEYTLANGRYARAAEPDNQAIANRLAAVTAAREAGEATLPTTIALERETNPFMRARSAEELAERRAAKDAFRG